MYSDKKRRLIIFGAILAMFVTAIIFMTSSWNNDTSDSGYSQPDIVNSTSGESNSSEESTIQSVSSTQSDSTTQSESIEQSESAPSESSSVSVPKEQTLHFRNARLLEQHYQKHGIDMGYASAEEYEKAAAAVVNAPDVLHKTEAEDGDDVYYIERTNEFVVVSTDGYLRTYFNPDRGKDYFDRQ